MEIYSSVFSPRHTYTFATDGLRHNIDKVFSSRQAANEYMYGLCAKYNLHIVEVYDDKHDKTYKCDNGVKIHINRM